MMRNTFLQIKRFFGENTWLSVAVIIILIAIGFFGWKWCLDAAGLNRASDSINALTEREFADTGEISDEEVTEADNLTVEIHNNQAYLVNARGETVFGPCLYIYDELDPLNYSKVFRYIDNNGLIGYGKAEETEITVMYPGVFSVASKMSDGSACVKEGNDYYYIDVDGKRFTTGKYINAYPFGESQGSYARVQKMDGSWCVIDRQEKEYLTGFDYINELPYCTLIGSGSKDKNVVLFSLDCYDEYTEPTIIKEYDEYSEINDQYIDFAFVTSQTGKKGVICIWNGEVIVPAEYIDIEWGYCDIENTEGEEQNWFRCQKEDGSYDIRYWEF